MSKEVEQYGSGGKRPTGESISEYIPVAGDAFHRRKIPDWFSLVKDPGFVRSVRLEVEYTYLEFSYPGAPSFKQDIESTIEEFNHEADDDSRKCLSLWLAIKHDYKADPLAGKALLN